MSYKFPIVILNHGKFGAELIISAELIVGKINNVRAVSLLRGMTIEEYYVDVKQVLTEFEGKALVLTDMYGGTPSNIALMIQKEFNISVLCGVNLPMLLELLLNRETAESLDDLINRSLTAAREAVFQPQKIILNEFD